MWCGFDSLQGSCSGTFAAGSLLGWGYLDRGVYYLCCYGRVCAAVNWWGGLLCSCISCFAHSECLFIGFYYLLLVLACLGYGYIIDWQLGGLGVDCRFMGGYLYAWMAYKLA